MLSNAHRRITRLATLTAVHRAFHWLHLHQPQLRLWQLDLVRIPAPPFGESARAAWFAQRFLDLGLSNVHTDEEGNVLAELCPQSSTSPTPSSLPPSPCILLSAHLDTVFPANTPCEPTEDPDSARISAPGICDNAAGLSALLGIAAALRFAAISPPIPILFCANVGEEGEGDLRGMRHLFQHGLYRNRIAAAIALEGSGTSAVVTRALGSLRLRVTISGPGGHSWTDAGAPNPILLLSQALANFHTLDLPSFPLTTLNVGLISGGTSVNSIPESATALIDLRSTDSSQLLHLATSIRHILQNTLAPPSAPPNPTSSPSGDPHKGTPDPPSQTNAYQPPRLHVEIIGDRPAGALPDDSPLLQTLRAVDRHLSLSTDLRLGSTDANLPLSLGIPAIAIGTGGTGGGIHTLQEWYDPTGRSTALRRILLTLLDVTQQTALSR